MDAHAQPTTPTMVLRVSLTVDEAAKAIGISRSTLYGFLNSGEIPYFMVGNRRLIPVSEVQAWVSSQALALPAAASAMAAR